MACDRGREAILGDPKTEAGKRTLYLPPHVQKALKTHLSAHVSFGKERGCFLARMANRYTHGRLHESGHEPGKQRADLTFASMTFGTPA